MSGPALLILIHIGRCSYSQKLLSSNAKHALKMFSLSMKGSEEFFMKTKVSVYDCDTMIVSGTSYYLWVMDYYKVLKTCSNYPPVQEFSAQVQKIWDDKNCAAQQDQQVFSNKSIHCNVADFDKT